ncbi:uncharacterized protein LOC125658817 isoform X2 [Ostrea edulis]|uniref:uncharacterized protein LOC125658817 isoform X2 n=1 Tax=Ostrea edulis TaxID=37623 RepID=UPI0024AF843E|nr:uncharacterized protein LOC125658817 isoform X2 [Ostrea edulis]
MERQLATDEAEDDKSSDRSQSITNPNYCGPEEEESQVAVVQQMQCLDEGNLIILYCNRDFMCSFSGVMRLFQVLLSLFCLLAVVTSPGVDGGDFLSLPQSWHLRILVFVIVWTSLSNLSIWGIKVTGTDQMLPVNWWLLDFLLYTMFSLSYLISTSVVANYIEHLKLMEMDLPRDLSKKFLVSVGAYMFLRHFLFKTHWCLQELVARFSSCLPCASPRF